MSGLRSLNLRYYWRTGWWKAWMVHGLNQGWSLHLWTRCSMLLPGAQLDSLHWSLSLRATKKHQDTVAPNLFFFQMFPLIKKVSWEVSDFCRFGVEKDTLLDLLDSCSSFARLILKVWPSKDHRLKVGTRICSVWGTDEGSKHEGALALPRMVKQMHRTNAKTKELWYSYYFVLGSSYILKIS